MSEFLSLTTVLRESTGLRHHRRSVEVGFSDSALRAADIDERRRVLMFEGPQPTHVHGVNPAKPGAVQLFRGEPSYVRDRAGFNDPRRETGRWFTPESDYAAHFTVGGGVMNVLYVPRNFLDTYALSVRSYLTGKDVAPKLIVPGTWAALAKPVRESITLSGK